MLTSTASADSRRRMEAFGTVLPANRPGASALDAMLRVMVKGVWIAALPLPREYHQRVIDAAKEALRPIAQMILDYASSSQKENRNG